ncbi:MAG: hypothetical protein KDD75_07940, partial [Caldilineaceae bacterium]|nr:hypothetical protein [Caldilineaceae bacterium]
MVCSTFVSNGLDPAIAVFNPSIVPPFDPEIKNGAAGCDAVRSSPHSNSPHSSSSSAISRAISARSASLMT